MRIKRLMRQVSFVLMVSMLHLCWLTSYGWAEIVATESAIEQPSTSNIDRQRLLDLLNRQEVIDELEKHGISKVEAAARINSLTDEEVIVIAGKLDELPPGGDFGDTLVTIILFLPALILDIILLIPFFIFNLDSFINPFKRKLRAGGLIFPMIRSLMLRHESPEGEIHIRVQCYSRCSSNYHSCINPTGDGSTPEFKCEEAKKACSLQCETGEHKRSTYESDPIEHDDCDPGMESCD